MAKFGRFEFGEDQPRETYEGDRIKIEKNLVKILRGESDLVGELQGEDIRAVFLLVRRQSVRKID